MPQPDPRRHASVVTRPTSSSQPRTRGLVPRFRYGYTDQHIRVSDAERTEVADHLAAHFSEGRLNQAEFDERVAQAMNAKTPGTRGRGPNRPVRPYGNPFFLVLLVVVISAVGTAGEAVFGRVPGMKTWLTVGVITAIVVYAVGILSRSRAARGK